MAVRLNFLCIRRLGSFFCLCVPNLEVQYCFVLSKKVFFLDVKLLWLSFFGVIRKIGLYLWVFSMHFRTFS